MLFFFQFGFCGYQCKIYIWKTFCGENAGELFFYMLDKMEEKLLLPICKNKSPLDIKQLSQEELERFHNATYCETCHENVKAKTDWNVE